MSSPAFDIKRLIYTAKTTKRFWIPLFVVCVAAVNGMMIFVPKKYQSTAQVLINKPKLTQIMGPVGTVLSIGEQLATIRENMTSFNFLSEVARRLNLGKGMPPDSPEFMALIQEIRGGIALRVKGQDLFAVGSTATSPELARDIAQTIVNQWIEATSQHWEDKTKDTKKFIERELDDARRELRTSQEEVQRYKEANPNEIPDVFAQNSRDLLRFKNDVEAETAKLQALHNTVAALQKKLAQTPTENVTQRVIAANAMAGLLRQKYSLEQNLEYMRQTQKYGPRHPKVQDAIAQIQQIERELASQEKTTTQTETTAPNPQYLAINEQINTTEAEINLLETDIPKKKEQIATLEKWQKQVPKHQLDLQRLESAVSSNMGRVNMLQQRLNEAKSTTKVEESGQGPSFQPFDPARVNPNPVAPNPKKFAVLGLAMGSFASGALIYLLTLLDSAVRSAEEARRMLQMPVLGVVQRVVTATDTIRQARRRRFRRVGFSLGAALVLGVVVLGMTVLREPLQQQVNTLRTLLNK